MAALKTLVAVLALSVAVLGQTAQAAAEGAAGQGAPAGLRLLMIDRAGCEWCALWDEEVGVVYAKTAEGARAPLIRSRIGAGLPDGVTLERRALYTPTFILLEDGREIGRIEGYPGEAFFYGLLGKLLERAGAAGG